MPSIGKALKDTAVDHSEVEGNPRLFRKISGRPGKELGVGGITRLGLLVFSEQGMPVPRAALQKEGRSRCFVATSNEAAATDKSAVGLGEKYVAVDRTRVVAVCNVEMGANAKLPGLDDS